MHLVGQKTPISTGILNLGQNVKCIGFVDEIFGFSYPLRIPNFVYENHKSQQGLSRSGFHPGVCDAPGGAYI